MLNHPLRPPLINSRVIAAVIHMGLSRNLLDSPSISLFLNPQPLQNYPFIRLYIRRLLRAFREDTC